MYIALAHEEQWAWCVKSWYCKKLAVQSGTNHCRACSPFFLFCVYFFSPLPKRVVLKHTHTIYWPEGIFSAHLTNSGWVNGAVKPCTVQSNLNAAARV